MIVFDRRGFGPVSRVERRRRADSRHVARRRRGRPSVAALSPRREAFLLHRRDRSLLPSGRSRARSRLARSIRTSLPCRCFRPIHRPSTPPTGCCSRLTDPDVDGAGVRSRSTSTGRRCRSRDRACQHGGQSLCQRIRLGERDARVRVRRLTESTATDVVRSSRQAPRHAGRWRGGRQSFTLARRTPGRSRTPPRESGESRYLDNRHRPQPTEARAA